MIALIRFQSSLSTCLVSKRMINVMALIRTMLMIIVGMIACVINGTIKWVSAPALTSARMLTSVPTVKGMRLVSFLLAII